MKCCSTKTISTDAAFPYSGSERPASPAAEALDSGGPATNKTRTGLSRRNLICNCLTSFAQVFAILRSLFSELALIKLIHVAFR